MKNRLTLSALVFLGIFFTLLPACKKEAINNDDHGFAMTLTAEKPNRNTTLQWTEVNVTDFEEYVIVRSTEVIPDDLAPTAGVITRIDNYKTTTFEDASVPFEDSIHYKVFAKIGDRFLSSPSVVVKNEISLLDISVNNAVFDTENHIVFLHDIAQNTIVKYNYETNTTLGTLQLSANPFGQLELALGNHGNGNDNELYVGGEVFNSIRIYNTDDMSFKTSINVSGFVFSIVSGDNDFLYVYTDNWQNSFSVYKRSTKQFISGAQSPFAGNEGVIGLLGEDGFKVTVINFNIVNLYSINSEGQNTNIGTIELLNGGFFGSPQQIRSSKDGELFIPDVSGTVVNKDLEIQGLLTNNQFSFFQDYVFSDNGEKVWALNTTELIEIAVPSFDENMRIILNYQVLRAVKDGNEVIIVGIVFDPITGQQRTIIDKIPVEE